jgi:hypothetical protein
LKKHGWEVADFEVVTENGIVKSRYRFVGGKIETVGEGGG